MGLLITWNVCSFLLFRMLKVLVPGDCTGYHTPLYIIKWPKNNVHLSLCIEMVWAKRQRIMDSMGGQSIWPLYLDVEVNRLHYWNGPKQQGWQATASPFWSSEHLSQAFNALMHEPFSISIWSKIKINIICSGVNGKPVLLYPMPFHHVTWYAYFLPSKRWAPLSNSLRYEDDVCYVWSKTVGY